jgi:hypothetical protein
MQTWFIIKLSAMANKAGPQQQLQWLQQQLL